MSSSNNPAGLRRSGLRRVGMLVVTGVAAIGTMLISPAVAAGASVAPSAQDTAFLQANAQTNLAEIALGNLALEKSQHQQTRNLATTTLRDHQAAQANLQTLADQLGVTLPTAPNPTQQKAAAMLRAEAGTQFDLDYAMVQVVGHRASIADTNAEINHGSTRDVISYAHGYLPVATMHLQMAESLQADLGGTPTAVPAGNGGMAAAATGSVNRTGVALSMGGALLLMLAMFTAFRRRVGGTHSRS